MRLLVLSLLALPCGALAAPTTNQPPVAVNDFATVSSGVATSISVPETRRLFSVLDKLKKDGLGIIYISHRPRE